MARAIARRALRLGVRFDWARDPALFVAASVAAIFLVALVVAAVLRLLPRRLRLLPKTKFVESLSRRSLVFGSIALVEQAPMRRLTRLEPQKIIDLSPHVILFK